MDPITLLATFAPLLVHGGKALIERYLAPDNFKPATIEEFQKTRELDLQFFQAVNNAGGANPSYAWVEAIVRLQRPFVVLGVVGAWVYLHFVGTSSEPNLAAVDNAAAIVAFYLFGDRTLFYAGKVGAK